VIVIDSSALFAIIANEAERAAFSDALAAAPQLSIGAPTLVELRVAIYRRLGDEGLFQLNAIVDGLDIRIHPFDGLAADLAHEAFLAFGKGRHRANLNYGDCMAYAVAKSLDSPLLFKGDDFGLTDIESAL
jgi:ribonuclease VapC